MLVLVFSNDFSIQKIINGLITIHVSFICYDVNLGMNASFVDICNDNISVDNPGDLVCFVVAGPLCS